MEIHIIINFLREWKKYILFSDISATIRPVNTVQRQTLTEFGQYVAECLPKYVQKVSPIFFGR